MPRPEPHIIQLTIDGREVRAPEGMMLVDAAKQGDVEIPYFCYQPQLGKPVGACRMCLVEIEGIPKLQTSCSTPVKDGMVVHTQTDRVRSAQHAIVEFLLVNHPLDCPVCDKGGECPLQDITFGWGLGRSRFIEPKRHFVKPLALSPLVAIDRERCILCYRCVRFSQEIAEDYQLIFAERGADTFVATHDGHPYVAPFSGNIVELCPVGALTSQPYRFRARPWDIEGAGGICTLCPSQCNVEFTVRDERVLRVLSRHHPEVDDGWLCDKGRFAYQAIHSDDRVTRPLVRDGGELRPVSWERALEAAAGLARHKGHVAALVGGRATNEEGFLLQRLMREGLESADVDSAAGPVALELRRALADPKLQATVSDLEFAHAVLVLGCEPLDESPILDLRIRKGVRRNGVKLAVATARPSALDPNATLVLRSEPGAAPDYDRLATFAKDAGDEIVILYGEQLASAALLEFARSIGARLLEIPAGSNGRGLREAGLLPDAGPGYAELESAGRPAQEMAAAEDIGAFYLFETDPVRDRPDRALWERALHRAGLVVAHASVLTEGISEHANVVFPAESHAEKEGTLVHPDGRVQRMRTAIGHPDAVRAGWWVLAELCKRVGLDTGVLTSAMAFAQLVETVPFYRGLTLDELAGRGVRWPEREEASGLPAAASVRSVPNMETDPTITGALPAASAPAPPGGPPPAASAPAPPGGPAAASAPAPPGGPPAASAPAPPGGPPPAASSAPAPPGGPPPAASAPAPPSTHHDAPENGASSEPEGGGNGALRLGRYRPIWADPQVEISPALQYTIARQQLELSPEDAQRLGISSGQTIEVVQNGTRLTGTAQVRSGVPVGTAFLAEGIASESANALTEATIEVRKP
jgi:NADH-quinone oxidoreductase subunit G